jgi:chromosome segregation ATPase
MRRLISEFEISLDWLLFNRGPIYYKNKGQNEETEKKLSEVKNVMAEMQKELSEAQNEYSNLQKELELAQQKISEYEKELEMKKQAEEAAEESVLAPDVQELIDTMQQVPLLHHEILAYYYRFKTENKQLIAPPHTQGKRKQKKAAPIV